MKKTKSVLTVLVLLLLCVSAVLTGCNDKKATGTGSSSTNPSGCSHSWEGATCITPKTCSLCNKTEGTALGHKWSDANCTSPKTCSSCGEIEGVELGHSYVAGKCSACGVPDKNSDEYKYEFLKKKADSSALSCARTAVRKQLKNPSTMKVLDEKIIESDNYFRYTVCIKYTAENNLGGTVTDEAYVMIRVSPEMDGTFTYRFSNLGMEYAILISDKDAFKWGIEPDDWSLDACDKYINPDEVSLKLLIANPTAYEGKYVKIKETLQIASNNLSRKSFRTYMKDNFDLDIEVFYKLCDNMDECIMLDAKYQLITVIGEVKTYSDSTEPYIDAVEIIFH